MVTHVRVTGAKDIQRALLQLGDKEAKRVGRASLRKAGNPILKAARAAAPVHDGRLRRALKLRVDQLRQVGVSGKVLSALIYVAKGQGPRPRKSDRGDAKYSYQIGSYPEVYGGFVEWGIGPHAPVPQPFLRPAWDSEGGATALTRLGTELGQGLEKAAAGLMRPGGR